MENVDIYPKCPHCQVELEYHDQLSTDYDDMYYFVTWSAFCPQCQRTFTFVEDFKLTERRFLSEEDPIQMRLDASNRAGPAIMTKN